jgi:RNA polymerase sigma-70 factor (ECF subfamily)
VTTLGDMLRKARTAVLRKGVSAEDADDIVHEAFLRLHTFSQSNDVGSAEALLVRSAVNLSIDTRRRMRRSPIDYAALVSETLPEDAPGAEEILDSRARLRHANEAISRLPEQTRRCLLARRLDGLSYGEIAAREQLSVGAVQERVARATLALMKWMDEC